MKTKLLTLLFSVFAITSLYAQSSGTCGSNLKWSFNYSDSTLTITGKGDMTNWTSSAYVPWRSYFGRIKYISFPDKITSIGDYAFCNCTKLISIIIPENVTTIGEAAFYGCSRLDSVVIPENVSIIKIKAFINGVKSVILNSNKFVSKDYETTSDNCKAIFGDQVRNYTFGPNITKIGKYAFSRCTNVDEIVIPDNIQSVGLYAFENCSIKSVIIGTGVPDCDYSFGGCSKLKTVKINSDKFFNRSYVDIASFFGTQVEKFIIGDSVSSMCKLEGCPQLNTLVIGKNVTNIADIANCPSLTTLTIPENVVSIGGKGAFKGNTSLKSIVWNAKHAATVWNRSSSAPFYDIRSQIESFTIGDSVEVIPYWLCHEMNHITSITFPEKLKTIRDHAFWRCSGLTCPIVIPDNVTDLGDCVFEDCSNIPSATIGDGVTSINSAFSGCSNLSSVTIGKNVSHIDLGAFYGCNRLNSIVWNAINCEDFSDGKTPFYNSELAEDVHIKIKSFTFGDEVQSIPAYLCYAMHCCEVTIPKSVIRIGTNALYRFNSNCSGQITNFLGIVQDLANDIGLTPNVYNDGDRIYVPCGSLEYYREKIPRRPQIIQYYSSQYSLNLITNHTQGTIASNVEPSMCDSIIEITALPNEGYHFTQWSDGNQDNPRIIYLKQDTTFTAQFAKNMYLVQFFGFNDVLLDSQSVEHGTSAVAPEVPQVEHYDFVGWDKEFANVTSNLDIFAIYQQNATDVEKVNSDSLPQKVVIDGHIYILRGEHVYDAQGKMMK